MHADTFLKGLRQAVAAAVIAALLVAIGLFVTGLVRGHPQDLPWTKLDLGQPIGMFTGRKLAALGRDFPKALSRNGPATGSPALQAAD